MRQGGENGPVQRVSAARLRRGQLDMAPGRIEATPPRSVERQEQGLNSALLGGLQNVL